MHFEIVHIPSLIMKHLYKTIIEHKVKHGMGYGYFLMKLFHHFNIHVGAGKSGSAKKSFTLSTLVKCECVESKGNPQSKLSQFIKEQDQLKHVLDK